MTPDVMRQAAMRQVAQFARELARARRGVVRGVHQSRVASRRLRESLGALRTVLPKAVRRQAGQRLREMARALGAVRECDVTLALAMSEAQRHEWPAAPVAALTTALREERKRRHRDLREAVAGDPWRRVMRQLRSALRAPVGPGDAHGAVLAARERRRRRGRALLDALAHVGTLYVPDQLHAVRLAAKKLRYSLEWEQQIGQRAWTRERQILEAAQDQLGEWHDRLVLQERLNRLRRAGDYPRLVAGDFRHMAAQLERECRARHAAILVMTPALARVARAAIR